MPFISVIVPVYNLENYIHVTINALLNQTSQDFEVIVVNDGSRDRSIEIVETMFSEGDFSSYQIVNKVNGGVSSARNVGIEHARGEFLLFLDGDDYIDYNLIELLSKAVNRESDDVVAWGFNMVDEEERVESHYFDLYKKIDQDLSGIDAINRILTPNRTLWVWTGSAVYRHNLISKNGLRFDEDTSYGEDQEFILKAIAHANNFKFLNEEYSFYMQRGSSAMAKANIKKFDTVVALLRINKYFKENNVNNQFEAAIKFLETDYIIDNYLFYYYDFVNILRKNQQISHWKAISILNSKLKTDYFEMLKAVHHLMRSKNIENQKLRRKSELFLKHPILVLVDEKMKNILSRKRNGKK